MHKRPKHPNKDIEAAIIYAELRGWRYKDTGRSAHAWGRLLCPLHKREGHQMSIWSTPKDAYRHAKQIMKLVDQCMHEATREVKNENT